VPAGERAVSNIVFMGMGEPLYNFDGVKNAIETIVDGEGLSIGKRRITVSTSGVVPEIERLGKEIGACSRSRCMRATTRCATSLCRSTRNIRSRNLLDACRAYPGASNARRITFEYVMLKGVNDTPAEARALVRLLKGIPAKINLIPFNPWPGTKYECSDWETIEQFSEIVFNAGYASPGAQAARPRYPRRLRPVEIRTQKLSARERMALRAMAMTD
jgi:23S rRNA (adenine2503-C2)-methyltransferase